MGVPLWIEPVNRHAYSDCPYWFPRPVEDSAADAADIRLVLFMSTVWAGLALTGAGLLLFGAVIRSLSDARHLPRLG